MTMTKILLTYGITALVFFAVDLVWLGVIAKNLYAKYLGHFLAERVNWAAAIIFYALYIIGIILFAVEPGVRSGSFARELGPTPETELVMVLVLFGALGTNDHFAPPSHPRR